MKLQRNFYTQSAVTLAPQLLGKILCRQQDGKIFRARITETEAYVGAYDTACHAYRGKTPRNSVMFEQGGRAYVYLCYGIHNLLNVVTGEAGEADAVLIRGMEAFNGPGKLTKAMNIDRTLNGIDLTESDELWLEDDGVQFEYTLATRIGIDYASEEDCARLWRFVAVSK